MRNYRGWEEREYETFSGRWEGTLQDRYDIYRSCANDGKGNDSTPGRNEGKPLLTFDEWLGS